MHSLKVVLVGDTKVGKSCILSRFVQGTFDRSMPATIGAAFLTKVIGNVRLQLWDTAGQEKFRSLAPMYYRSANVAILFFDLTNLESFQALNQWATELEEKIMGEIKLFLVGNKVDLVDDRKVTQEEADEFCKNHNMVQYYETSAKKVKA